MGTLKGRLLKMESKFDTPIQYSMPIGDAALDLNPLIGKKLRLTFENQIFCTSCGKLTKKSFFQGFCYPCFINAPEAGECILRPELCLAHEGKGRDPIWEQEMHNTPHAVYLALTSSTKVGVTRWTQIPSRWIDQGAAEAIVLAKTPNRYLAGCIEVALKAHLTDKTPWQRMLKNEFDESIDLVQKKSEIVSLLPKNLSQYVFEDDKKTILSYPVSENPEKVKSVGFDKQPIIEGILTGIRAQYLMFGDTVFNVRKHGGYVATISY